MQKATQSKAKTERAEIIETAQMDILGVQTENHGTLSEDELEEILTSSNYNTQGTLSNEDNILDKTLTSKDGKYTIAVSEIYGGTLESKKAGLYNETGFTPWNTLIENSILEITNGKVKIVGNPNLIEGILVISNSSNVNAIAIQGASQLTRIEVPGNVKRVDLSGSGMMSVKLSDGIEYVTFSGSNHIVNINIPKTVTSIPDYAFSGCSSLEKITIEKGSELEIPNNKWGATNATIIKEN